MKMEDKNVIIEQIAAALKEYAHFYLTDTATLNAEKTSALRKACFNENIKLMVVKNTLLKKALESLTGDFSPLYGSALKGSTSIMFSNTGNTPAKLIKNFGSKNNDIPAFKAAYVEESFYVGKDYLETLVSLKGKNELIGDVIALLQSPAKNVISALQSGGNTIHGILKTLSEK
ncbi:MAG: 50S ribosomal protein L10 [Bacteroidales bacterium]|jgi:large subunit ribosomal protein L10|nr:50S ribosomal protein L10 [Bacteroidales bacterium]